MPPYFTRFLPASVTVCISIKSMYFPLCLAFQQVINPFDSISKTISLVEASSKLNFLEISLKEIFKFPFLSVFLDRQYSIISLFFHVNNLLMCYIYYSTKS